jgi:hypothetical protein
LKKNILKIKSVAAFMALFLLAAVFVACGGNKGEENATYPKPSAPTDVSISGAPSSAYVRTETTLTAKFKLPELDPHAVAEIEWAESEGADSNPSFTRSRSVHNRYDTNKKDVSGNSDTYIFNKNEVGIYKIAMRVRVKAFAEGSETRPASDWTDAATVEIELNESDIENANNIQIGKWLTENDFEFGNNSQAVNVTLKPNTAFRKLSTIFEDANIVEIDLENLVLENDDLITWNLSFDNAEKNQQSEIAFQIAKFDSKTAVLAVSGVGINVPLAGRNAQDVIENANSKEVDNVASVRFEVLFDNENSVVNVIVNDDQNVTFENVVPTDIATVSPATLRSLWLLENHSNDSVDAVFTNRNLTLSKLVVSNGTDSKSVNMIEWLTENDHGNNKEAVVKNGALKPNTAFTNLKKIENGSKVDFSINNTLKNDEMITLILSLNDDAGNWNSQLVTQFAKTGDKVFGRVAKGGIGSEIFSAADFNEGNSKVLNGDKFDVSIVVGFGTKKASAAINGSLIFNPIELQSGDTLAPKTLRSLWLVGQMLESGNTESPTTAKSVEMTKLSISSIESVL